MSKNKMTKIILNGPYIKNSEIETSLKLAIALKKPLLLEGDAGTGKTTLAKSVADELNAKLLRIQCFEGITKEDILYESNSEKYFSKKAIVQFLKEKRAVLLIDEIDKADEKFEAFLLEFLEEKQVTINELNETIFNKNELFLVFITSNNQRELSKALKRRCIYLHLDYPSAEREFEILSLQCSENFNEILAKQVVSIVQKLRKEELKKKPSVAETIEFYKSLLILNKNELDENTLKNCLNLLLKYKEDIEKIDVSKILSSTPTETKKKNQKYQNGFFYAFFHSRFGTSKKN